MFGSWGISSVGRAPALQAGCQRFESVILHGGVQKICILETAPPYSFPSSSAAELVTVNHSVAGSNPALGVANYKLMNYNYPLYAPWWKVELGKKSWGHTLTNLFKMINVKDNEDGSFIIEWDENDPAESIFNDWTKEDFIQFFKWAAKNELREDTKESGEESQEDYYNSESEGKDFDERYDQYIQATNEETFGIEGDELSED